MTSPPEPAPRSGSGQADAGAQAGLGATGPRVPGARSGHRIRRPLLDARGAGAYTGLGERYIRRLRAERRIDCILIGGRLLFDPEDLDRLIDGHRVAAMARDPRR
ncbi:MAG: helix-turn-helix domain-containing protein [Acidimicrobiales bacterium]